MYPVAPMLPYSARIRLNLSPDLQKDFDCHKDFPNGNFVTSTTENRRSGLAML